jgi:hypothetical protein
MSSDRAGAALLCGYTGAKVFTATKAVERERLGDAVTAWLGADTSIEVVDTVVRQSSDQTFHCLSIVVFYRTRG